MEDYHRLFSVYSDDEGQTWSTPQERTDILSQWDYPTVLIATGPGHGLKLSTGRLVAPVWICDRERADRYKNTTKDRIWAGMIYSDDQGQSWQTGGLVPAEIAMLHESTIAEREDGSLLINMRSRSAGYRAVATSTDGGLSWSEPELDKQLPDPTVQGSLIQFSGDTLLFSNPAVHTPSEVHSSNRTNLTLRMSTDGGKHWSHARTITEGPSGYSDLAVGLQSNIICLYENGAENYRAKISFIAVDKAWLLHP